MKLFRLAVTTALAASMSIVPTAGFASSHREAPFITRLPKVDHTDVYAFRSYEPGRENFVTIIANWQPIEEPHGGPNYYTMDPDAVYEIHVDNNGDAREDLTFQFDFNEILRNNTGNTINAGGRDLSVPLRFVGPVTTPNDPDLGQPEDFDLTLITGDRRTGARASVTNAAGGGARFERPLDNVGRKTIPDYPAYARQFMYNVNIPGCAVQGRMFAGQRQEAFAIALGEIFDLVNFVPLEPARPNNIVNDDVASEANVATIAIEVPIACITGSGNGVVGVWSTTSLPQGRVLDPTPTFAAPQQVGGALTQVSRLGAPLVNELVIGIDSKDLFNAAKPTQDGALAQFITNPTFPEILDRLFRGPLGATSNIAPRNFPRRDLVAAFLTGIPTLNQQSIVTPSEMARLNTRIAPTPRETQSTFGVVGGDLAGFPNGRRPGDDAVDLILRVAMGRLCYPIPINGVQTNLGLCTPADAPVGNQPFTDGAPINARFLQNAFPYLNNPIPCSPKAERLRRRDYSTPQ
jgi:hypothetical protein